MEPAFKPGPAMKCIFPSPPPFSPHAPPPYAVHVHVVLLAQPEDGIGGMAS